MLRRAVRPILTATALFTLLGSALVGGTGVAQAAATKVTTTTATKCWIFTYNTPTDWYFPSSQPTALVWLQHGFTESKNDYAGYAASLADQGYLVVATTLPSVDLYGCTINNTGNNTSYLNNVAALFGTKDSPSGALNKSFTAAKAKAGRSSFTMPTTMAFVGHSAGGEGVSYVANRLRTAYPTQYAQLKGIVLEDSVNSPAGSNMSTALRGMAPTPIEIYATASPDNSCNSNQSGTKQLIADLPGRFHGAQITTGNHQDVFGSDTPALFQLVCGTPKAANVSAVRGLTTGWIGGFVTGADDAAYFPGGSYYDGLVDAGTISTLP